MLSHRPELVRDDDYELVGLKPVDSNQPLVAGSHIVGIGASTVAENDEGWVTSIAYSPHLKSAIGAWLCPTRHQPSW